jgi:hypothetical protein
MLKKVALLVALASVATVAMADESVVIKDTRAGVSVGGAAASGVLLTRQDGTCMRTEYTRSSDSPNEVSVPVVKHDMFPCDALGNRVSVIGKRTSAPVQSGS